MRRRASAPSHTPARRLVCVLLAIVTLMLLPGIAASHAPEPIYAGRLAVYKITVINRGPSEAVGVTASDTLDRWLTFVSSDPPGCRAVGQRVTCPVARLGVNETATYSVTVRTSSDTPEGTLISNIAEVTAATAEGDPADNLTPPVDAVVRTMADLSLQMTVAGPLLPGRRARYRITVSNRGPSAAAGVTLVDELPEGLLPDAAGLISGAGLPEGCTANARLVVCRRLHLAADATWTVDLPVRVASGLPSGVLLSNTVGMSSQTLDLTADNDVATVSTRVGDPPTSTPTPTPVPTQTHTLTPTPSPSWSSPEVGPDVSDSASSDRHEPDDREGEGTVVETHEFEVGGSAGGKPYISEWLPFTGLSLAAYGCGGLLLLAFGALVVTLMRSPRPPR
ncbi:DUF11 domain-containing protein [Sinosporangium siamense]|uniref:DUF11 domain-containing protein n=1 Tax=Sinosporangium siamense TaxID=1367973 RepID=A0A919RC30_9ACTN|nr:DUF11 domain-containing protein [Sinosporangium siamense]GII91180.1 hypothetical protein Ssi02_14110 [Sinosporangium siamense]